MEATPLTERSVDAPFEIESDMRVSTQNAKSGKMNVQDYVESIAARYPLLGMAVLQEDSRSIVEKNAQKAIRLSLDHQKLNS
jgi:hypothetical protein